MAKLGGKLTVLSAPLALRARSLHALLPCELGKYLFNVEKITAFFRQQQRTIAAAEQFA